jgi:hypothetical protein
VPYPRSVRKHGVVNRILNAASQLFGHLIYVNGEKVGPIEFATSSDVPFGFIAIPQYATERRPVGEEVVGRPARSAREGIGADSNDPDFRDPPGASF